MVKQKYSISPFAGIREIYERIGDIVYRFHVQPPRFEYISPSIINITGYSHEEFYADPHLFHKLLTPGDLETVKKNLKKIRNDRLIYRIIHKNGSVRWVESNDVFLADAQGKAIVYEGVIRDITTIKETNEKLKKSEERFRLTFHTSPDSVNINRLRDGMYVNINKGFTTLTGYTREDVIGRTSHEIDIWADPSDREQLVAKLLKSGKVENLEARFRMKDGTLVTGLMSAIIIELDGEPHIISVTRSIEDRIRIEKRLKVSEAKYRMVVQEAPEAFFQANTNGNFILVNKKASILTGYTRHELLNMNMSDLFSKEELGKKPLNFKAILQGRTIRIERRLKQKNGQEIETEMVSKMMPDQTIISFIKDISEQKETEIKLKESEERYRTLVENSHESILIVGDNRKLIYHCCPLKID